jgi:dTDP-L-rhamnose 4-epimerase
MTVAVPAGERILITGGAGFIGTRLCRALGTHNAIMVYDNLHPQVHGPAPKIDLPATLVRGDICNRDAVTKVVESFRPTIVIHLAAETGTGQSFDEPGRYCSVNVVGTANLIEAVRQLSSMPKKFVLAASRAVYGEGSYADRRGNVVAPLPRRYADMEKQRFDLYDEEGRQLRAVATKEDLSPSPGSVYGSTKLMQEYLLKQTAMDCSCVALRLQNVYGPGQSLRNPYTGVLSIFCKQALDGATLNIFEDGEIIRDFVYVDDVVAAFVAACGSDDVSGKTINIGSGRATSILSAAEIILVQLGQPANKRTISGDFRAGDIRHAVADISAAREYLGWWPRTSLEEGLGKLTSWAKAVRVEGVPDGRL